MAVRTFRVTLYPHTTSTTVAVVMEDTSGRRRVIGGVGRVTLPIGIADFHGEPLQDVLTAVGEALKTLGSPRPREGGSAPLEGPQGETTDQLELPLNLT
jgi:hypothetical protein